MCDDNYVLYLAGVVRTWTVTIVVATLSREMSSAQLGTTLRNVFPFAGPKAFQRFLL